VHFKDRTSYLVALHRRFYAEIGDAIQTAIMATNTSGPRRSPRRHRTR
jgi:hypothetical protein